MGLIAVNKIDYRENKKINKREFLDKKDNKNKTLEEIVNSGVLLNENNLQERNNSLKIGRFKETDKNIKVSENNMMPEESCKRDRK